MHGLGRVAWHFFVRWLFSGRNLFFFVLLVAVLLAGILSMHSDRTMFQRGYSQGSPIGEFDMPYAQLDVATAHQFVWNAVSYRFLHSASGRGGLLLPMRFALRWLAFVIPVIGLALSFDAVSRDVESGVAQTLLALPIDRKTFGLGRAAGECGALSVTVVVGLGGVGLVTASLLGIPSSAEQLARMWTMLVGISLLLVLSFLVGSWISARVKESGRALWLAVGVLATLFLISVLIDHGTVLRDETLPEPPAVSVDVGRLLREHAARGYPALEVVPPSIESYFEKLTDYSEELSETIRHRHQIERWIHAISPSHLLLEIAGQLLQDEYVDATDVIFSRDAAEAKTSLAASLLRTAPEFVWLLLWIGITAIAYARQLTKLEV